MAVYLKKRRVLIETLLLVLSITAFVWFGYFGGKTMTRPGRVMAADEAYEIARTQPDLLREMPCFCGCDERSGHRSNLDCFKDKHGATWKMCVNIARDAAALHKQKIPIPEIRKTIIAKYGDLGINQ